MKSTIETNPNAIGYMDLAYVTDKMTAVKINDVAPTDVITVNTKFGATLLHELIMVVAIR